MCSRFARRGCCSTLGDSSRGFQLEKLTPPEVLRLGWAMAMAMPAMMAVFVEHAPITLKVASGVEL